MKLAARNNIVCKLISSKWGAGPEVLRATGLVEYGSSRRSQSTYANKIDIALKDICRIITGRPRPTKIELLYLVCGTKNQN